MSTLHVAGLSGSLRRGSYNTALLRAAQSVLPADTKLDIVDYAADDLYGVFGYDAAGDLPGGVGKIEESG